MGTVVAIFGLVGFESSTAFGEEAVNPLKTIPRSIIWSLIITASFFIFITYVEVQGTAGASTTLDKMTAPLNTLAVMYGVALPAADSFVGRHGQLFCPGVFLHRTPAPA